MALCSFAYTELDPATGVWSSQKYVDCILGPDGSVLGCDFPFQKDRIERRLYRFRPPRVPHPFVVPEGVTEIGTRAFYRCTSLLSVTFPDGVTTIEAYAFADCSSLASVTMAPTVTKILYSSFENCTSLASLTIPAGVTVIRMATFAGCSSLAFVRIPEGVTNIETWAFEGCSWLVATVLPQSCAIVDDEAFKNCPRLSLVVAPDALEVQTYDEVDEEYVGGGSIAEVFPGCPLLPRPAYVTPHTPDAVVAANRLEYWTPETHHLCQDGRREWVQFALLTITRGLELPHVVAVVILRSIRRSDLGPPIRGPP